MRQIYGIKMQQYLSIPVQMDLKMVDFIGAHILECLIEFEFDTLSMNTSEKRIPGAADSDIESVVFRPPGNINAHLHAELASDLVAEPDPFG